MDDKSTTTSDDQSTSYLEQLVGEGRKYTNPEDLAKAYFNANGFIDHLKTESSQLKEELEKRMTLEDILSEKQQAAKPTETPEPVQPANTAPIVPEEAPKDLDLGAQIRQIMQEQSQADTAEKNIEAVLDTLMATYGDPDKARDEVARKAQDLGVDRQTLMDVATKSPKAFYELTGLKAVTAPKLAGTRGDVNTSSLESQRPNQGNGPKEGTYAFYQALRKENPKLYFSSRVQNEIMKKALAAGDAFYS